MISRTAQLRKPFLVLTLTALAVGALSACSPPATAERAASPTESRTAAVKLAWESTGRLLSRPVVQDNTVLAHQLSGEKQVSLVAWDLPSGTELWRAPVIPGTESPTESFRVTGKKFGESWVVAYMSPITSPKRSTEIHLVDLRTGKDFDGKQQSWKFAHASSPVTCGDSICLSGMRLSADASVVESDQPEQFRFDPVRHDFMAQPLQQQATGSTEPAGPAVAPGLILTTGSSGQQALRYQPDSTTLWERKAADAFAPGWSRGGAMSWDAEGDVLPLRGALTVPDQTSTRDREVRRLDRSVYVGLDRKTGKTVWSLIGMSPCSLGTGATSVDGVTVVCHFKRGTATAGEVSDDLDVDLVGLDAATGKERWRVALGNNPQAVTTGGTPEFMGSKSGIVRIGGSVKRVDFATGAMSDVSPAEKFLCVRMSRDVLKLTTAHEPGAETGYYFPKAVFPCDSQAKESSTEGLTREVFDDAGYKKSEYLPVTSPRGIAVYKLG